MPGPGDRGGEKQKPKNASKTLKRLLGYMLKYGWVFFILLICAFAVKKIHITPQNALIKLIIASQAGLLLSDGNRNAATMLFAAIAVITAIIIHSYHRNALKDSQTHFRNSFIPTI